jgi:hypothetical protein
MEPQLCHVFEQVHLADSDFPFDDSEQKMTRINVDSVSTYDSFCDDFGPMNLGSIYKFCCALDNHMDAESSQKIVVCSKPDRESKTNACFLIGAYMILCLDTPCEDVVHAFAPLLPELLSYRDISPGPQTFHLRLEDCWEALSKAAALRWVDFDENGFDAEEYAHYDDPRNADLHVVVPGKLIAMKGPVDLPAGQLWCDTPHGARDFSPPHCAQVLRDLGARVVVRLSEPPYAPDAFRAAGIAVAHLPFDARRPPPAAVVAKFLLLAEAAPGAVAVHCTSGLGRTGTLLALHLVRAYGLTARQAMAWLRIVRPGSVVGAQQHYVCAAAPAVASMRRRRPAGAAACRGGLGAVEALWAKIESDVDGRLAAAAATTTAVGPDSSLLIAAGMHADSEHGGGPGGEDSALHATLAGGRRSARRGQGGVLGGRDGPANMS